VHFDAFFDHENWQSPNFHFRAFVNLQLSTRLLYVALRRVTLRQKQILVHKSE